MAEMIDGSLFGSEQPCFGCSPSHPIGFRLTFERDGEEVVTRFVPRDAYQGPPGIMHGGLVMTLADEIGAWAIIAALGKFGFTVAANCRLRQPVRIGVPLEGRGRILKPGHRIVETSVTMVQEEQVTCEATLKFALLDKAAAEKLLGAPLPEQWRTFGR